MSEVTSEEHKESIVYLWNKLSDISVNDDGEIGESFLSFEVGTHREQIWHWFEDTFDISVHKLMYGGE